MGESVEAGRKRKKKGEEERRPGSREREEEERRRDGKVIGMVPKDAPQNGEVMAGRKRPERLRARRQPEVATGAETPGHRQRQPGRHEVCLRGVGRGEGRGLVEKGGRETDAGGRLRRKKSKAKVSGKREEKRK
jgi:hypothetical protein